MTFPDSDLDIPLHESISKLLLSPPDRSAISPALPGWGTLQPLNQQLIRQPLLDFLNYNLRGIGQVIFVNNPFSGLLILVALFIQSPWVGCMSVVGVVASTLTAIGFKLDRASLRNGFFGFNGILVGAAIATFGASMKSSWHPLWICAAIIFAGLSTLVMKTTGVWFAKTFRFPFLTMPFIVTTLLWLAIVRWNPSTPTDVAAPASFNWLQIAATLPIGFGQVFLMDKFISGLLVLLAVAICTPIGAAVGLLGSLLGILAGLMLNAPLQSIYAGLWSYNGVLTAIAISGVFYAPTLRSIGIGSCCAFISAVLGWLLGIWLTPWHLPSLTLAFCLVTIGGSVFLQRSLPSLVPVALHTIASPEEHRLRYLVAKDIMTRFHHQLNSAMAGSPRQYLFDAATDATKAELEYLFQAIDNNRNNTLSVEELTEHLRHLKRSLSEEEINCLFQSLDIDRNGEIDFAEFGELMLRHQRLMANYHDFVTYFLPIDANQDNEIDIKEMNRAFASVGQPQLTTSEADFLYRHTPETSMTWNRFIELLLVT